MAMGELQDFTIDQFAGAAALILGSVGGLLMIIWKSRCHCRMNCCYLLQCERRPPENDVVDSDEEAHVQPGQDEQLVPPPGAERDATTAQP